MANESVRKQEQEPESGWTPQPPGDQTPPLGTGRNLVGEPRGTGQTPESPSSLEPEEDEKKPQL
jgi:hypothetical protein